MRRYRVKLLILAALTAAILPLLAACTQSPPATLTPTPTQSPTSTLTPLPTDNDIVAVSNFLAAAVQRYQDGLTCDGTVYTPDLRISETDFIDLAANARQTSGYTSLLFRGQPCLYRAFFQAYGYLRGTVNLGEETVSFEDPHPGVTSTGGGIATVMKVYQNGKVVGEDDYYDQTLNFYGHSVGVIYRQAGDVKVLDIYYKPDCAGSQPHLTLVLVPVPAPAS